MMKHQNRITGSYSEEAGMLKVLSLLIFAFGFGLYFNTLNHDYALDDKSAIEENSLVKKGFAGVPEIMTKAYRYGNNGKNEGLYRPLSLVMFAVEYQLWGGSPRSHHFFNIFLYALCGVLLFILLCRCFKEHNFLLPLITSLLFIAHPVHTEAVANIKSRDEILCFIGLIISLFFLLEYFDKKQRKWLTWSAIAYFMALLSKENAITFLAVYPLFLFVFSPVSFKDNIKTSMIFLAIACVYLGMMFLFVDKLEGGANVSVIQNSLMAAPTLAEKYATAIYIMGKYLWLLIFPYRLLYDYSYNQIPVVNFSDYKLILSLLVYLAIISYALISIKHKKVIAFGVLFFCITMSVVSNLFITIEWTLGERFLFIPSFGYCLILTWIILKITRTDTKRKYVIRYNYSLAIVVAIILSGYAVKTIHRNQAWKNNYTLFSTDVNYASNSSRVHGHLGKEYTVIAKKEIDPREKIKYFNLAVKEYKQAIGIYPDFYDIYNELGVTCFDLKKVDEAIRYYKEAIRLHPSYTEAYHNLGVAYGEKKEYETAISNYLTAIKYNPQYVKSTINLANDYYQIGDYDNAVKYCKEAIKSDPDEPKIYHNLGVIYYKRGDTKESEKYLQLSKEKEILKKSKSKT